VTEDADWFNEIAHKKNFKRLKKIIECLKNCKRKGTFARTIAWHMKISVNHLNRYFDVG
jgi:hypothetical protein